MKKRNVLLALLICLSFSARSEGELDLRTVLDSQKNNAVIDIPTGTYILNLKSPTMDPYSFNSKKNVVINGNGSRIICNRQSQAFYFTNCENVTFKDVTIEYDPPCSSQGIITALSNDKKTWTVELQANYPTATVDQLGSGGISHGRILAYDKNTRLLKKGMWTLGTDKFTKIGDNVLRFIATNQATDVNPIQVGDFVAFEVFATGWYAAHTIILDNCKKMTLDNVTVYDSNCFSFLEYGCEATHYHKCVVTRKLGDEKYGDRLRAGTADMLHSKHAKIGPFVDECTLEYAGDDAIAINGSFYPIFKADKASLSVYLLSTGDLSGFNIKKGDKFVCVNNDGSIRGTSHVTGVISSNVSGAEITATFNKLSNVTGSSSFTYGMRVVLSDWIEDVGTGDVGYSNDRVGSGYKIVNCTVGGNRSRAILIKASDGLIDGNLIHNSAMSGIALAPEFYWMEGGCPQNTIIRNNTIQNCMFDSDMNGTSQFSALVAVSQAPNGSIAPAGSLKRVAIYDNVIEECPWPAVGLAGVDSVYFHNNTIGACSYTRNHGSNFGVSNNRELFRLNVTNFSTTNDCTTETGIKTPIKEENLVFVKDGIINIPQLLNEEYAQVNLYDLMGKKILSKQLFKGTTFSIENKPKGMYVMELILNGESHTSKIINN